MSGKWENNEVVERLREYLRIPSVHPDIDYRECVTFLKKQARLLDLPLAVHELVRGKPVVVMTWTGLQPELPSILLNSHMDVVPVYEEHWTYPPFDAHITEDGLIYARGIQDMKSLGMMYLEAVRIIQEKGIRLKRTVHVSFVPDEEIGSQDGMKIFSESDEFKKLNIGFALDESAPNPKPNEFYAFNSERTSRQIVVTCRGTPGHGSFLWKDTAGEKIHYIIDKFMKYRANEMKKYEDLGSNLERLGEITTVNLTQLQGGVQVNVLPENLSVTFDIRIAPDVSCDEFDKMIAQWCEEAGKDVTFEYLVKNPEVKSTNIKDDSVPYWDALVQAVESFDKKVNCVICGGATDARHVRLQGIPAINITPISNTPTMLHCHDERLNVKEYFNGIDVTEKILQAVANV